MRMLEYGGRKNKTSRTTTMNRERVMNMVCLAVAEEPFRVVVVEED